MDIRLFKPSVGDDELAKIREVFDRAWLGLGPLVSEFESEWTRYIGTTNSIAVNSGTAALHLALAAFSFPAGSKVLVPALTFVATATAVLYNRLTPVFVDADEATLQMDLEDLERKIDGDCVAVIPVHYGGHPVPMKALLDIARRHSLAVIEDCAHCSGGEYEGKKLGTWGDIGCFSFEEKKGMTTGDGGMICSDDAERIAPLRAMRWIGIDKDTWKRHADYTDTAALDARHWHYEVALLGYKYNMNDVAAAIGLVQLAKLDAMNARRRELIARYLRGIDRLERVRPMFPYELEGSAYWLFGVRCDDRDSLIRFLKARGIATGVHFMPIPMHPLFASHRDDTTPVADRVWTGLVTLPLHADLTDGEVDRVIEALREWDRR
jgi:perosamine synthetase